MNAAPKPQQGQEPEPKPGIEVDDHLYVHANGQPCTGRVVCHGRHGVTVDVEGKHHKVTWDKVLGHKRRIALQGDIVDQGEDGMIVQDRQGRRRYVAVPNEATEDPMVAKSLQRPALLFMKGGMPPGPGLTKKPITDKNGVQTTRWVSTGPKSPPAVKGQHVGFENGEHRGHGQVIASGQHGVTVRDSRGGEHRVHHEKVTHHWQGDGAPVTSPHEQAPAGGAVKPHEGPPETFNAKAFAAQHDDPSATADSIVSKFGGDAGARIKAAMDRLGSAKQTHEEHKKNGVWSPERAALHRKIIFEGTEIKGPDGKMKKVPGLLAPERIKAATPVPGEKPTFIALGGRGGSGKSKLNGLAYDVSRAIVLDADHIKGMLPEYQGWNAHQVHEESSDLLEAALTMARICGLNVVFDATMKSAGGIQDKLATFKQSGFRTEAHYMHLPRQKAAERAIGRFLNGGEKGRFVPPSVVMGNTKNEENFDSVKSGVDAWSFHDNSGDSKESQPTLIARKGESAMAPKQLIKSDHRVMLVLSKGWMK